MKKHHLLVVAVVFIVALVAGLSFLDKKFVTPEPNCKETADMLDSAFVKALSVINDVTPRRVFTCDGKVITGVE